MDLITRATAGHMKAMTELSYTEAVRLLEEACHVIFRLRSNRTALRIVTEELGVLLSKDN